MYKLTEDPNVIFDMDTQTRIPSTNWQYQAYLDWKAAGNTPLPYQTLDERRLAQRAVINAARDAMLYGGMTYQGNIFQSDPDSRRRIANAASGVDFSAQVPAGYSARTMDDQNIIFSGLDMVKFQVAMHNNEMAIVAMARVPKEQINVSNNPESIVWPPNASIPLPDGALLGAVNLNIPVLVKTALQPGDVPSLPILSTVATTGSYQDLNDKPPAVDMSLFATSSQGAKADTAVQPTALTGAIAAVTAQIPKGAAAFDITCNAAGTGSLALTGYTVAPKIIPILTVAAGQTFFPQVVSYSATNVTVAAWRTKGTLLLSAGPLETAPNGVVRIAILP